MDVAVTGTPGTGKTTAVGLVETDLEVVHLNDVIETEGLWSDHDEERGSLIADLEGLAAWFENRRARADAGLLVESHLAHHLDVDRVVVLRCHPERLLERLTHRESGDVGSASTRENAEAEALDLILAEAVDRHGGDAVYEVDTTDESPDSVAEAIEAVLEDRMEPTAGTVDFTGWL